MKKIVARINDQDKVEVKSSTKGALDNVKLDALPACKNWDVLRKAGFTHTGLKGYPKEAGYLVWLKGETDRECLEIELAVHDWWHMMSDDYGVCRAGEGHLFKVRTLMGKIDRMQADALWNQYCPEEMRIKVTPDAAQSIEDSETEGNAFIKFDNGKVLPRSRFTAVKDEEGEVTHWETMDGGIKYYIWND